MDQETTSQHPKVRLYSAIALSTASIAVGVVLFVTDGLTRGVSWSHHSSVSALPLFLVAVAITAETIARPRTGRHGVMRAIAVVAFVTWGIGAMLRNPTAAGVFNDAAVLLFAIDAGAAVITDARITG